MRTPSRFTKLVVSMGTVVASLSLASPVGATWSVVGVDPETGEVGVAVASCVDIVDFFDVDKTLPIVALVPGRGAGVSQADFNDLVPPEMARLLSEGTAPSRVVVEVTDAAFDADAEFRQHGVVTLDGDAAAFTGTENPTAALDRQAENVTAQGNTLVGDAVIEDALAAFVEGSESPLADRLVAALWAGSERGGDARCGEQTALFASVAVAEAGDDPLAPSTLVTITADEGAANPVRQLAEQFGALPAEIDPESTATDDADSPTPADDDDDASGNGGTIAVIAAVIVVLGGAALAANRRRSKQKQTRPIRRESQSAQN